MPTPLRVRAKAFALVALLLFTAFPAVGNAVNGENVRAPAAPYVNRIRFSGNKAISDEELRQIIATSEHTSFLGLGLFGGARKPFNPEEFDKDLSLIRKLYTYKGYFFTQLDTSIVRKSGGRKVELKIRIHENEPSRIDSLRYVGIERVPGELQTTYLKEKHLKSGEIFSVERLIDERNRTLTFFKDYGYAFFHEDSIRIKVDTVGTHAGILFRLSLPQQLRYGPVRAIVHNGQKNRTTRREQAFAKDQVSGIIFGKQKINPDLIVSAIAYRPGKVTSQSLEQRTLQNFGVANIFSSIYINPDSVRNGELYTTVHLETAPKHQIEPKLLVDNRYGDLFFGGSLAYENKNLFGGAEQFRSSIGYGSQAGSSNRLLANLSPDQYTKVTPYEFSLKNSLVMPVLKKPGNFYSVTTEYSSTKQPVLLSTKNALIRSTYGARLGPTSRLNFDFFEFELVRKDSLNGFKQLFKTDLAHNIGIDPSSEAAVNAGIDSLLNTHINQILRLRYNYTNRPVALPKEPVWNFDLLLEESGGLTWLVDQYLDTKSYPGFTDKEPQIFGTAYSQYVKLESELRYAKEYSVHRQLAARAHVGWMLPYGKAETTPEERRFYAGGSNSMRGWLFNTLGPGRSASEAAANFGADIKLELGLEYRLKFFRLFNQPSGVTFFTDVGNIWDRKGPYAFTPRSLLRDYAWDAGAGMRIGSPIGPFRFDFAYKIHDPADPQPWRISKWKLGDYTFNFGIGEAF